MRCKVQVLRKEVGRQRTLFRKVVAMKVYTVVYFRFFSLGCIPVVMVGHVIVSSWAQG